MFKILVNVLSKKKTELKYKNITGRIIKNKCKYLLFLRKYYSIIMGFLLNHLTKKMIFNGIKFLPSSTNPNRQTNYQNLPILQSFIFQVKIIQKMIEYHITCSKKKKVVYFYILGSIDYTRSWTQHS